MTESTDRWLQLPEIARFGLSESPSNGSPKLTACPAGD